MSSTSTSVADQEADLAFGTPDQRLNPPPKSEKPSGIAEEGLDSTEQSK